MLYLLIILVVLCFSFVVFVGPPYLPTLSPQVETALDMLDLKPGQAMLELGCGDGKVMVAAASRGWRVTGIELNPLLALVCIVRTWRYRKLVRVVWGNYWHIDRWGDADGIFGFVLPRYMTKLDGAILRWQAARCDKAVALASFAFEIPGKTADEKQQGVLLYRYPGVSRQKRGN